MTVHILFIDRSSSACGTCGKETLPDGASHTRVAGYGGGRPGCGVTWTHVSSHYAGMPGAESGAALMRPDLQWMDPMEAIGIEVGLRSAEAGRTPGTRPVTDLDEAPA